MIEQSDQYSPEEFLAAARNAEADGRLDYALQFYTHLVQSFPETSAGRVARDALGRLQAGAPRAPSGEARYSPGQSASGSVRAQSPLRSASASPTPARARIDDFDPSPVSMAERLAHGPRRSTQPASRSPTALTSLPERLSDPYGVDLAPEPDTPPSRRERRQPSVLPSRRSGFWVGRVLAWCITALGLAMILAAIAVLAISLLRPQMAADLAALLQVSASLGRVGGLLLAGFAALLAGQLMSAVFVIAIETRDAARVLRARARDS